jgi:two-component system, sensor histidine kinase and response regulator
MALGKAGHQVTLAANGREAVQAWAAGAFDLVLMDVQMPEVGGYEATRLIRDAEKQQGRGRRTPIIALTAHSSQSDRDRSLAAGMDAFVTKPLDFKALAGIMADLTRALPWNAEAVMARLGIDRPALAHLLALFREDSATLLAQLREAAGKRDGPALTEAAHRLNGAAGPLGGADLQAAAARLEALAASEALDGLDEALAAVEAETRRLLAAISVAEGPAPPRGEAHLGPAQ